jgi:hypothetical protein
LGLKLNDMSKLGLNKFLKKFPDDAKTWAKATDEVRDIAREIKEHYNQYDEKKIKPCDFTSLKTPSDWNTKGKKYINKVYDKMSLNTRKIFNKHLKDSYGIK